MGPVAKTAVIVGGSALAGVLGMALLGGGSLLAANADGTVTTGEGVRSIALGVAGALAGSFAVAYFATGNSSTALAVCAASAGGSFAGKALAPESQLVAFAAAAAGVYLVVR